jgi:hypothetical protein
MLAVVLAAGLFPNAGTVSAQTSSCPYGGCASSSAIPAWEYVTIFVLVAAGVILAVLFLMRRRRPPRAAAVPPPVGAGPSAEVTPTAPAAPAGPAPPYVETPEDVGHAPPPVGGAGEAAAPAWAEPGTDIDSLMAELDKISGDILKKAPKKGATAKGTEEPEEAEGEEKSS